MEPHQKISYPCPFYEETLEVLTWPKGCCYQSKQKALVAEQRKTSVVQKAAAEAMEISAELSI